MSTWLRLTLITMTVGGGFSGLAVMIQYAIQSPRQQTLSLLLTMLLLTLYAFVTAAGLVFAQSPRRTLLLFGALLIQVPWLSSSMLVYKFAAGAGAFIGAKYPSGAGGPTATYEYSVGTSSTVAMLQGNGDPFIVGVNLWAIVLLILLWRSAWTPAVEIPSVSEFHSG